ncbi:MAG: DUF1320 domain-containing protein [Zoogloeaceae bacterium]|jgi:phage gp36-like protein|nr:DUF1320 domain-containing protein [Zoogloeaceae bacterium]
MPYATLADMVERFGQAEIDQCADITGDGVRDLATVAKAAADADAEIDAALARRYRVPLRPAPLLIKRIACDLMRESLWALSVPEAVKDRAKIARLLLKSLQTGDAVLPGQAAAEGSAGGGLVEIVSGRGQPPFASPVVKRRR